LNPSESFRDFNLEHLMETLPKRFWWWRTKRP
jgi:hypothetical protein